MAALARGDGERLLRFVGEAESLSDSDPFPPELLVELGRIVPADWVTYCELDRVRKRVLLSIGRPDDPDDEATDEGLFWNVVCEEHPVCVRHQQGSFAALKLSDFLTQRQLRKTRLYRLWLRPWNVEHQLNVAIPSPLWHTKTFLFDRASNDFTERDRTVLDLLQSHFARLWRAAKTRRLLAAALEGLAHAAAEESRGVFLLAAGDALEFASPPAQRILRDFFPAFRGPLPPDLSQWLAGGSAQPLIRTRPGRKVVITRSGDAVLLEEKPESGLTARESEVLSWVARGKTNVEIARLLHIAPSTVRKHLENVYAKLGVGTRTAAVARFFGLGDENRAAEAL